MFADYILFVLRSLAGKLRIGLAEQSVLQALAHACVQTPLGQPYPPPVHTAYKSVDNEAFKEKLAGQSFKLKTAYCECPTYDVVVPALLEVCLLYQIESSVLWFCRVLKQGSESGSSVLWFRKDFFFLSGSDFSDCFGSISGSCFRSCNEIYLSVSVSRANSHLVPEITFLL